jgi:hypothetical protein
MEEIIDAMDELNIYLVINKLKPASYITLTSLIPEEGINEPGINEEDINSFIKIFNKLGIVYHQNETANKENHYKNGRTIKINSFSVGKDKLSLDRLVKARNDEEIGYALGFPEESVKAFGKVINEERRDGTYLSVSLAKAKKAGLELPSWLAYISFIPEKLDIVNGDISKTGEELGMIYQNFVRKNNPLLAGKAEQFFLNHKLPDSWEKTANKSYILSFDYRF